MPGDKDLEKLIAGIGQDEAASAQKQAQIDRLKQLIEKQKKEMADQAKMINELQGKIKGMFDLPADVEELKRLIGEQRAELNNKDSQLELAYGQVAQFEAELKNTKPQIDNLSKNLDTYLTQVGELKAKLIEKEGILRMREKEVVELQKQVDALTQNAAQMEQTYNEKMAEIQFNSQASEQTLGDKISNIQNSYQEKINTLQTTYNDKIAEMQDSYNNKVAELQKRMDDMNKGNQDTYTQIAQLKSDLMERDAKITKLQMDLKENSSTSDTHKQYQEDLMKQITDLRNQLAGKELSIQEQRAKIESQLRDELFSQKGDYTKRIAALESEKMQTDITIKEYRHKAEDAEKKADEIKAKMEELMAKYDGLMVEHQKCGDIIKQKDGSISDLSDFKSKNLNVALNLKGLQKLFETEPQFKAFNIVAKVGEVSVDEIRTALGVPSVTTNKFVQAMVNAGVFEISPNGKITLKNKLPGF